jgi:hypothetical protein
MKLKKKLREKKKGMGESIKPINKGCNSLLRRPYSFSKLIIQKKLTLPGP